MRSAIACIPEPYMALALRNDRWFTFVSLLAVVIHCMQAFERAVIRLAERLVIWPFVQIRRTVHYSDSLMIEYFSATAAGILALWVVYGRDNSVAHQLMVARIPSPFWITVSGVLSLAQFWCAAHGTISSRAACSVFATALWILVSLVLVLRVGFSMAHVFSLPMVLACWLSIFMLIAKGQPNGPAAAAE